MQAGHVTQSLSSSAPDAYEPLQVDTYAEHLAAVNRTQHVIAHADILNSAGILLIRKGQPLTQQTVERIIQFKLLKPLESSIQIENTLSAATLFDQFKNSIEKSGINPLYSAATINELEHQCENLCSYPLLAQKLTVLQLQMPNEFNKSLFVAWAGNEIARQMLLSYEERIRLFIASIAHDFGMLHIPVEIITSDKPLTTAEWRVLISHTVIGQKIMEGIPQLPTGIARAVLEHHELANGTGYPVGKFIPELGLHGQMIALLDSCYAIFSTKLVPQQLSPRFLATILQMNSANYRPELINLVIYNLRKFKEQETFSIQGDRQEFLNALQIDAEKLMQRWQSLAIAVKLITENSKEKSRRVRAIATMGDQLYHLLCASGMLEPNFTDTIDFDPALYSGDGWLAEETHLMLQELHWQFQKLTRLCLAIAHDEKALSPEQCKIVQQILPSTDIAE